MIRNVIPEEQAETWTGQLDDYLRDNPHTRSSPPEHPDLYELFWSLPQLNARAHPNMLAVHKFLMGACWHHAGDLRMRVSTNHPVTYADRLRTPCDCSCKPAGHAEPTASARVDGGSVERWEASGYGGRAKNGTYRKIWSGEWEDYDPWDSGARLDVTDDLYGAECACSVFRMFQGIATLSPSENPPVQMCPLPLKPAAAYWLLRPFFSPKRPLSGSKGPDTSAFLDPSNWMLDPTQSPVLHGAQPGRPQEISALLHPHLELDRTLVPPPRLGAGDFVIWHPDAIYADRGSRVPPPASRSPRTPPNSTGSTGSPPATFLYVPACPLTRANALYIARQRRAFVLGFPGPHFTSHPGSDVGESRHMGRPGVQEVHDAGGEMALRAMGLLAWEEDDAVDEDERMLLRMANGLLFPDHWGMR